MHRFENYHTIVITWKLLTWDNISYLKWFGSFTVVSKPFRQVKLDMLVKIFWIIVKWLCANFQVWVMAASCAKLCKTKFRKICCPIPCFLFFFCKCFVVLFKLSYQMLWHVNFSSFAIFKLFWPYKTCDLCLPHWFWTLYPNHILWESAIFVSSWCARPQNITRTGVMQVAFFSHSWIVQCIE